MKLGGDVRFADAEHLGDLAVAVLVEVEEQERAVELGELGDQALGEREAIGVGGTAIVGELFVAGERLEDAVAMVAAGLREGDVERDAVGPGGEAARAVVGREGAPKLGDDLLGEVLAVAGGALVGGGHAVDEAAVLAEQGDELFLAGSGAHRLAP